MDQRRAGREDKTFKETPVVAGACHDNVDTLPMDAASVDFSLMRHASCQDLVVLSDDEKPPQVSCMAFGIVLVFYSRVNPWKVLVATVKKLQIFEAPKKRQLKS